MYQLKGGAARVYKGCFIKDHRVAPILFGIYIHRCRRELNTNYRKIVITMGRDISSEVESWVVLLVLRLQQKSDCGGAMVIV